MWEGCEDIWFLKGWRLRSQPSPSAHCLTLALGQIRVNNIRKVFKIAAGPIHSHFIIELNFLRTVGITLAKNLGILSTMALLKLRKLSLNNLKRELLAWPNNRT